MTVDPRIYLKSILLEFRFFRLASFFWISPEKCKLRFWQFRAAPWPRDIVGSPAPLLISNWQVYKSALAVRSMRVLASGNFPFPVPAKLVHGRGKKARNLFPSFSPVSCFLGSVPFLFRLPPFHLVKPGKSFRALSTCMAGAIPREKKKGG